MQESSGPDPDGGRRGQDHCTSPSSSGSRAKPKAAEREKKEKFKNSQTSLASLCCETEAASFTSESKKLQREKEVTHKTQKNFRKITIKQQQLIMPSQQQPRCKINYLKEKHIKIITKIHQRRTSKYLKT